MMDAITEYQAMRDRGERLEFGNIAHITPRKCYQMQKDLADIAAVDVLVKRGVESATQELMSIDGFNGQDHSGIGV